MTISVTKPSVNLREKLNELDQPQGLKGTELLRADTVAEARTAIGAGRKNLIINGGFDVWQRGTSSANFSNYATADRWKQVTHGNVSKVTVDDRNCLKFTSNTGTSYDYIRQFIEDFGQFKGKTLTLSFDMKASQATQYRTDFWLKDNSDTYVVYGGNNNGVFNGNITTSWDRYSVSITVPSSYVVKASNAKLEVNIGLVDGTNGIDCYIDNVQLEVGSTATDFEHRSYGEELALCQRYYEKVNGDSTWFFYPTKLGNFDDYGRAQVSFAVQKRDTPTITWNMNGSAGSTGTQFVNIGGFNAYANAPSSSCFLNTWTADAEL